jgi:outer membrane protein OmpA-like peptidoglycan-associated protein
LKVDDRAGPSILSGVSGLFVDGSFAATSGFARMAGAGAAARFSQTGAIDTKCREGLMPRGWAMVFVIALLASGAMAMPDPDSAESRSGSSAAWLKGFSPTVPAGAGAASDADIHRAGSSGHGPEVGIGKGLPTEFDFYMVYFAPRSASLEPAARRVVRKAARFALGREVFRITLIGHAGAPGSEHDNQDLSERRAETVRRELVAAGVSSDQIVVVAQGKSELAVPTASEINEPRNRRVVIMAASLAHRRPSPARFLLSPPPN